MARGWDRLTELTLICGGTFVLAFFMRLAPVLIGGGLGYYGRYDDGVYYTAADALTFGRLPYHDFVLLQPPGNVLALAPFAALGRVMSDAIGMTIARLAFMGVGGVNAVLVALIARRWGRWQAVVAGTLYACAAPAIYSEQATFVEPLAGTAVLLALFLLVRRNGRTPPAELLAGVALGLACSFKIWYVAPWAVIVGYELVARHVAAAVRVIAGGAAALVVVLVPFFVLAPSQMWNMVIRDQVFRQQAATSRTARLVSIFGVDPVFAGDPTARHVATVVVIVLVIIATIASWMDRSARLIVVVMLCNLAVLLASPSYFRHYGVLATAPIALVLAIGIGQLIARIRQPPRTVTAAVVVTVSVAVLLAAGVRVASLPTGKTFPAKLLSAAAPAGCIAADDPAGLIQMNRLSQDFRDRCVVPVDVTGITYGRLLRTAPDGKHVSRTKNHAFQRYLYDYLTSAAAFVVIRSKGDASPPSIVAALRAHPVIARAHGITLRRGLPAWAGTAG